jgi:hypothetical protein
MVLKGRHCESCLKVVINYKNNSLLLCDGAKPTLKFLAPSELKLRLAELYAPMQEIPKAQAYRWWGSRAHSGRHHPKPGGE